MWLKNIHLYDPVKGQYKLTQLHIQNQLVTGLFPEIPENTPREEIISFPGHYLYPGFIDSHCHLLGFGSSLLEKNIFKTLHPEEWAGIMTSDEREILIYRGWDETELGFFPDLTLLDSFNIKKPILLIRKCGHSGFVNSILLHSYALSVFNDKDGTDLSRGLLTEKALISLKQQIHHFGSLQKKFLETASRYCRCFGITSVHTEDCSVQNVEQLIPILQSEQFLHIHEKIMVTTPSEMEQVMVLCKPYQESDHYSFGSFKIYMDGSLGAFNANLSSPYSDKPEHYGYSFYSVDELILLIQKANHLSKQLAIHVIGDEALEKCIQAFEFVSSNCDSTIFHRLVHVQLATETQLKRIQKLPLIINLQPTFAAADKSMADSRLGKSRHNKIGYPFHAIAEHRIPFSISSDAPVETMNPFVILSHAEKFMSRKEAFYAFTVAGAKQSRFPQKLGLLETDSYADGFLLSFDLFDVKNEHLSDIIPDMVLSKGKLVFNNRGNHENL